MRSRLLLSCLAVSAATLISAAAAGAAPLRAAFGNGAAFPSRTLVVSAAAGHAFTAGTLHVQENGRAAPGVVIEPISTANQGDFGAVLVIDTSDSMSGAPLRQAMVAARTLGAERSSNQELSVIEFNRSTLTVLPLTKDAATINNALDYAPRVAFGTHIYDATLQAIQELHDARVTAGTVIVLSDGQDVGSHVSAQTVAAAAAADHVPIYTVGVKDRSFTPLTLTGLARATNGTYALSSAAGLRTVFTRIESQLTRRYLVKYRSRQGFGRRVQVRLWVDGIPGVWSGSYVSPPAPRATVSASPRHRPATPFWTSTLALVAVSLISALLLVGGLFVHGIPRTRRHVLRERIGEFTTSGPQEPRSQQPRDVELSERTDTWLSRFRWWPKFKEEVDVAGIERSPAAVVLLMLAATLTMAIVLSLLVGTPLVSLPVLLLGPALLSAIVRQRATRQRRLFSEQLPGQLEAVGSAMRAGHSVFGSLAAMASDAIDPTKREFERAVADERLGVPVEAALRPIARRMRCTDIEQLALVATLNQRTGGNMAEVLDVIAAGARERADLRRELRALTAQARLSRVIVTALPLGLLAVLTAINRTYVRPLFTTTAGIIVLCIATTLVLSGWFVMRLMVPAEE